jgi:hypothetical protein
MAHKFITPVSMQVTQEQYENDLKEPLVKMWYEMVSLGYFNQCTYLVTNYSSNANVVTNIGAGSKQDNNRHFIDHYNPELFIALAAMTGKTYGIAGEWWVYIGGNRLFTKGKLYKALKPVNERGAFIDEEGDFNGSYAYPLRHFRKATKEEIINHLTKSTMKKQTFCITGETPLLKAMEEVLNGIGYKSGIYSFLKGTEFTEDIYDVYLSTDCRKVSDKESYIRLYAGNVSKPTDFDVQFNLPEQWNECIEFCKQQLELWDDPEFKVGDWVVGWHVDCIDYRTKAWEIGKIDGGYVNVKDTDHNTGIKQIRHATPEEIEAAKTKNFKVGNFEITVKNGKAYHKNDDITRFVVELVEALYRPLTFSAYTASVKDVIFSKTGCENSESKLSEWKQVYDELKK